MSHRLPEANIALKTQARYLWLWIIPMAAVLFVWVLVKQNMQAQGVLIHIVFNHGHGIEAGDHLRYRGINVGTINKVILLPDLKQVKLELELLNSAKDLARKGSKFWIVRPAIDINGIRGLDALLGAKYLTVLPGKGAKKNNFVGIDYLPLSEEMEPGGIELVLQASTKGSLFAGANVNFRGLSVGRILSVGLASDASAIEAAVYIQPEYKYLLSPETKFWHNNGAKISGSITGGLTMEMDSIKNIIVGQIHFATPVKPVTKLVAGHRFILHNKAQRNWLNWKPSMTMDTLPVHGKISTVKALLRWQQSSWLRDKEKQKTIWLLPVKQGYLVFNAHIQVPEDAEKVQLFVDDKHLVFEDKKQLNDDIVLLPVQHHHNAWKIFTSKLKTPVDCKMIIDKQNTTSFVAAARFTPSPGGWIIDKSISFDDTMSGAAVIDLQYGKLIGLLWLDKAHENKVILIK